MARHFALSLSALMLCGTAQASSPDAWAEHYRDVVRDCLAGSKLRDAKPEGDLMMFSDKVGTGLLVRGLAEKSRKSTLVMCLRERGGKRTEFERVYDGVKIDASMLPRRAPPAK